MASFDVFISYASEDSQFASELAGGLMSRGFKVWYAEFELRVGDKVLESIERGLSDSAFGILLISRYYLSKRWTSYEMDILIKYLLGSISRKRRRFFQFGMMCPRRRLSSTTQDWAAFTRSGQLSGQL